MDSKTRNAIADFTYDVVIGSGRAEEMLDGIGDEPDQDTLEALSRVLGRPLRAEDRTELEKQWAQRLQEAANP